MVVSAAKGRDALQKPSGALRP
ncbi:hypothetical protein OF001_U130030 [Pseudomonas sp. OF001]|nr:hypothetical protein OF001_U130030 [Pseudomonas sp. OF001]